MKCCHCHSCIHRRQSINLLFITYYNLRKYFAQVPPLNNLDSKSLYDVPFSSWLQIAIVRKIVTCGQKPDFHCGANISQSNCTSVFLFKNDSTNALCLSLLARCSYAQSQSKLVQFSAGTLFRTQSSSRFVVSEVAFGTLKCFSKWRAILMSVSSLSS
jgi:hypothetical protein